MYVVPQLFSKALLSQVKSMENGKDQMFAQQHLHIFRYSIEILYHSI